MSNGGGGGLTGALRLLGFGLGAAVAFTQLPAAFALTWPWVTRIALAGYGANAWEWAPLVWKVILVLLLYAGTTACLFFAASLLGLLLAGLVLILRGRR
ncbi:MAG: hypothetical protein AAF968_26790 [Pseudomonadota bacterium]